MKIFAAVPIGASSAKNLKFSKKTTKNNNFSKISGGPPKPAAPYAATLMLSALYTSFAARVV